MSAGVACAPQYKYIDAVLKPTLAKLPALAGNNIKDKRNMH